MKATRSDLASFAALRGAAPAPEVQDRIVEAAMNRIGARPRFRSSPVLPIAGVVFATALLAFAVVGLRQEQVPHVQDGSELARIDAAAETVMKVEREAPTRETVLLDAGTVELDVTPLPPGGQVRVRTPQADVEVVGTHFSVSVVDDCTTVLVDHGIVVVRDRARSSERRLTKGEEATVCEPAPGEELVREAFTLAVDDPRGAADRLVKYLEVAPTGVFAEDALYHLWLCRVRLGELDEAHDVAERFLQRFGESSRSEAVGRWTEENSKR